MKEGEVCEQGSDDEWRSRCPMDLQLHQTGCQRHQRADAVHRTKVTTIKMRLFELGKGTKVFFETRQPFDAKTPDLPDVSRYTRGIGVDILAPSLEAGLLSEYDEFEVAFLGSTDPSASVGVQCNSFYEK